MRIGIVNDTPFAVIGLQRTLALRKEHTVAWVARDGAQAVEMCAKNTPDLVLMDLVMPVMNGVEATRRIMAASPCAVLIVTASVGTNASLVFEAMGHGALDAINTPELGLGDQEKTAAPFFNKLHVIAQLIADNQGAGAVAPRPAAPPRKRVPLVAIGASAGGPAALATVLRDLPKPFPAAIVIVQHVDERFAAGLAEWLAQRSGLPVRIAEEGARVEAGSVLLAGTYDHLTLKSPDRLGYTAEPPGKFCRPSVDVFFESVSELWPGEATGVLLTGIGSDGAHGLRALRDKGHYTIAQDQATSVVYGMPKAAAALNAAIAVLPLEQIATRLAATVGQPK